MTAVLVIGASGQVGYEMVKALSGSFEVIAASRSVPHELSAYLCESESLDSHDFEQLTRVVQRFKPRWVINTIAYTAVDKAEEEQEEAMHLNGDFVGRLAKLCKDFGSRLVHISSDYVYGDTTIEPHLETERDLDPLNVYARSKRRGEELIFESTLTEFFVFRTSWVYSYRGHNFLLTMLRLAREKSELGIVSDQVGAPTSAAFLAAAICKMIKYTDSLPEEDQKRIWGVYNLCPRGFVSWHGFAREIFLKASSYEDLAISNVKEIETKDYPTPAARPRNSRMDLSKLEQVAPFDLPTWQECLEMTLAEIYGKKGHSSN